MSTTDISRYLRWKKDVAVHDYAAASSYLSIRFGESRAEKAAAELRKLPLITRRPTTSCGPPGESRCRCPIPAWSTN